MAFRVSKAAAYARLQDRLRSIKQNLISKRDTMAAGNVSAGQIRAVFSTVRSAKQELNIASSVTGIAAYAQAQEGDSNYDVMQEFTDLDSAVDSVISGILNSVPTDSNGYVLLEQWSTEGFAEREFTPAQTSNLRTLINDVISRID